MTFSPRLQEDGESSTSLLAFGLRALSVEAWSLASPCLWCLPRPHPAPKGLAALGREGGRRRLGGNAAGQCEPGVSKGSSWAKVSYCSREYK